MPTTSTVDDTSTFTHSSRVRPTGMVSRYFRVDLIFVNIFYVF